MQNNRHLIIVPIIHTRADFGSLGSKVPVDKKYEFESQVVPKTKDINPFFREEIYWPKLLTHYIPTSMNPSYNNGLLIVEYKARS
jgi:hypothetical protein